MKYALVLGLICIIAGCSSPAELMNDQQVRGLSNDQLCDYKNNYRDEYRTEAEIGRRGLNCDRFHRQCLKQGNQAGTQAMAFCEATLRENERLRSEPAYDHFGMFGYRDYDRLRGVHHH